ncbi:unnamed protein product [Mytilus coruscus]|uniref:Reverse transcriptase domain-containing protein n=1 Tax=Mytilus coruscus TaxID=42192 RepID=A0A6J8A6I9_MYTCO|nr:unnamed protein product [Mytilus coruscus]
MIVTAKSIDDENPELSMIARRGYGGVAILWKKKWMTKYQEEEIHDAVKRLKNGKSSDIDGISAEHYKNAETELLPLILHILNTVTEQLDIPQMLKGGIMTPSVLKSRIDIKIHQIQNQLQRGFTEAIPMIFAPFLASEAIIQSSEDDQEVLLLTLDAEKAFDKLEHEILFNKVYHYGIAGEWIPLHSVTESGLGCHMGTIGIATPTCADDILVLANSECELQGIMDIVFLCKIGNEELEHPGLILSIGNFEFETIW